jgi:hypothetical protein
MTRPAIAGVAALLSGVLTVFGAAQSQTGPPAVPRDLEAWSYYDSLAEETENGLNLDVSGGRSSMAFSIVVRHKGRSATGAPRSIRFQFITGGAIVNTEYKPTLKITVDAGRPNEATLDFTSRMAPLTSARGGSRSTEWVSASAGEVRGLGDAATVRITVFGDTYDLRPDQIAAIKGFAGRVPIRLTAG